MWRGVILALLIAAPAAAQDRAPVEAQFQTWLEEVIWPAAEERGVSRATFEATLGNVTLNWDLPSLAPPGFPPADTGFKQAEFRAPARYFNADNIAASGRIGAQLAARHAATLRALEDRFGVPGHILLAIWGRESGFGQVAIRDNPFPVLATRGFMGANATYFTSETLALLDIAQSGVVPLADLRSSWAGALGQPQMMPGSYLAYAADGNGDGRIDIWGSADDTLASIASFLALHDWQPGRDWGFEVVLPPTLSCGLEGPDNRKPIAQWVADGVTRPGGRAFPTHELSGDASLMLPAGRNGPAFLVTPNFYVLKRYNPSDLYALFVGHVGDRIAYGVGDFAAPWGNTDSLLRSDVARIQTALIALGHDVGGADGLVGYKTRRAIGRWQTATGRDATCFPSRAILAALAP
ncbi:lytic murein transglycosylase [Yoonia sp. R2331]|uniref:lytic murein transglycosylase n=1 Tax=Yoonia sp. R2331 TaxID=3237238 RepID=UPI0034E54BBA